VYLASVFTPVPIVCVRDTKVGIFSGFEQVIYELLKRFGDVENVFENELI
jgi:hypothetical protein